MRPCTRRGARSRVINWGLELSSTGRACWMLAIVVRGNPVSNFEREGKTNFFWRYGVRTSAVSANGQREGSTLPLFPGLKKDKSNTSIFHPQNGGQRTADTARAPSAHGSLYAVVSCTIAHDFTTYTRRQAERGGMRRVKGQGRSIDNDRQTDRKVWEREWKEREEGDRLLKKIILLKKKKRHR